MGATTTRVQHWSGSNTWQLCQSFQILCFWLWRRSKTKAVLLLTEPLLLVFGTSFMKSSLSEVFWIEKKILLSWILIVFVQHQSITQHKHNSPKVRQLHKLPWDCWNFAIQFCCSQFWVEHLYSYFPLDTTPPPKKNQPTMFKMCHHHVLEIQFGFCGMRGASSKLKFLWTMFMDTHKSATNFKLKKNTRGWKWCKRRFFIRHFGSLKYLLNAEGLTSFK